MVEVSTPVRWLLRLISPLWEISERYRLSIGPVGIFERSCMPE